MTAKERRARVTASWALPAFGGALGFLVGYYGIGRVHTHGFGGMAVGSLVGETLAILLMVPVDEDDRERERAANDALRAQIRESMVRLGGQRA
jgi:hypothetical protein